MNVNINNLSLTEQEGIWDALDIQNAYLEGNNLFVATRMVQHKSQSKGTCKDFYRECLVDTDCYTFINETCKEGRCYVQIAENEIICRVLTGVPKKEKRILLNLMTPLTII